MAYTLPVFNTPFEYWAPGTFPGVQGPLTNFNGQPYLLSRSLPLDWSGVGGQDYQAIWVRLELASVLLCGFPMVSGIFKFKDSSLYNNYLWIRWWSVIHNRFPNEYYDFCCLQCDDFGVVPDANR